MTYTVTIAAILVAGSVISFLISWSKIRKLAKLKQPTALLGVVLPKEDSYGPLPTKNNKKNKVK